MNTPPPTDLDTLTDTVGSRIEFTAAGRKWTAIFGGITTVYPGAIYLRDIQAAEFPPTSTGSPRARAHEAVVPGAGVEL